MLMLSSSGAGGSVTAQQKDWLSTKAMPLRRGGDIVVIIDISITIIIIMIIYNYAGGYHYICII